MRLIRDACLLLALACVGSAAVGPVSVVGGATSTPQQASCGIAVYSNTLGFLHPDGVKKVEANSAADCCARCVAAAWCASWSMQHMWTPSTPCHLSSEDFVKRNNSSPGNSCGIARKPSPSPASHGVYTIDTLPSGRRQVFEGVQVELQSDSIGSWNTGMPGDGMLVSDDSNTTLGAPHDLAPSERERFATEVMRGVRTIRLAMGLFLRGLGADNKSIVGRWPSQMLELKQLQDLSGIDGFAPEYWSPPPGWKDSRSYYDGTLESFNATFLDQFAEGVKNDIKYLQTNGLRVKWWGLQNEPFWDTVNRTSCPPQSSKSVQPLVIASKSSVKKNSYSQCHYTQCSYYYAFKAVATKIKQLDPSIRIHANSAVGQLGSAPIANDPKALSLVDAWTWHTVNAPSSKTFGNGTRKWAYGKDDFTNEHEYQPGSPFAGTEVGTVAAVNTFLNTLTFKESPTGVIILHAIKPTTNLESLGYGWTWWRSTGTPESKEFPELKSNHFTYNYWTWNSVAPFVKTVPWNSIRLNVMEDFQRLQQRVVAFETPATSAQNGPLHVHTPSGKLIVVLTNEYNGMYNATVRTTDNKVREWHGYSFRGDAAGTYFNVSLGVSQRVASFQTQLGPFEIQWWYELDSNGQHDLIAV